MFLGPYWEYIGIQYIPNIFPIDSKYIPNMFQIYPYIPNMFPIWGGFQQKRDAAGQSYKQGWESLQLLLLTQL